VKNSKTGFPFEAGFDWGRGIIYRACTGLQHQELLKGSMKRASLKKQA